MKFPITSVALTDEEGVLLYKHCITAVGCMYVCWTNAQRRTCRLKGDTYLQML